MTVASPSRGFLRALVATRYLLGNRGEGLRAGLAVAEASAPELNEIVAQLSQEFRQERARALAAEVGRLLRALSGERIR